MDHKSKIPALRPRRQAAKGEHAREPSLLAPKVRVQPLLEIYTAEVRFTRKIIFFPEDTFTQIQGFVG